MDFTLPKDRESLQNIAKVILDIRTGFSLEPYGAYKAMRIEKPNQDSRPLAYLAQQKIADVFGYPTEKSAMVYVYNRFRFERLLWSVYEASHYKDLEKYADERTPNIVIYEPNEGVGFINGKKINFTRKQSKINKKLFDALFLAHPNEVTEDKLKSIVGMPGRNGTAVVLEINSAITNLRKICGVDSQVIQHKGHAKLDALTFIPDPGLVKKLLQR